MNTFKVLWLSVIDWDSPWQGAQSLASWMAADGHQVTFVETLGVRRAVLRDWRRLAKRLHKRSKGGSWGFRPLGENLWLYSPVLVPLPGRVWADRLNLQLLMPSLARLPGDGPLMVWTFLPTPLVVRLVRQLRPALLIYHCVDEIVSNPMGVAPGTAESEQWLVIHADHIFATSRQMWASRRAQNPNTTYLPDGADVDLFAQYRPEPPDLAELPRPRICFIGTVDARLDLELLSRVAVAYPRASLVLIGPVKRSLGGLRRLPNVHLIGARPHEALPAYMHNVDVLIIPYRVNSYTRNIHPAKTYEILATGKPLVTTDLPELRPHAGPVAIAKDGDEFLASIAAALVETGPRLVESRRQLALSNTWEVRYRVIEDTILSRGASDRRDQERRWV